MARIAKFFVSPLAWMIRAEVCVVAAFVLTVVVLCAGRWPGPVEGLAILTLDASALSDANFASTSPVNDWYDAHYLSVCSGMWNHHIASKARNQSTSVCWLQSTGYTFSIAELVGDGDGTQSPLDDHRLLLKTKAPFILMAISIATMGLAILAFLYGIISMARSHIKVDFTKYNLPSVVAGLAFFSCEASMILITISSAKITASSERAAGAFELDDGKTIHSWTHSGFFALVWISTVLLWLAQGFLVTAAFRIAALSKRGTTVVAADDRPWVPL